MQCLVDSSVLIDIGKGRVLPQLFRLQFELVAPELVLDELIEPDRQKLQVMGLKRLSLTPAELLEARVIAAEDGRLSMADCAVFIAARNRNMSLLTGDRRLRRMAEKEHIPVHGALWVLDQIEAEGLMERHALATALRQMLADGARLPNDACKQRLKRWGD